MKEAALPPFAEVTARYEKWLAGRIELVPEDLDLKHQRMREDLFCFFRATFYRWAQLFPAVCPASARAARVLAVGDLHVENFGTWRDVEARLVWGINDFDEATRMPWTIDLVRLAASAHLAIESDKLQIAHREACDAILTGYRDGLTAGGEPLVLAGRHSWLRDMVNPGLRDPAVFWEKLTSLPPYEGRVPKAARRGLERMMPGRNLDYRVAHRIAGLGSLGRQRFVGLAEFEGGMVCREAKALAPSAWDWARGNAAAEIHYQEALDDAVRAADPFVRLRDGWIVRRLAPDCSRIELALFPRERDETRLLRAMGWEIANLHVASERKRRLISDVRKRRGNWLHHAAARMVGATRADWEAWRSVTAPTAGTQRSRTGAAS